MDQASTDKLIEALNSAAAMPEAIEAEFRDLSPEKHSLVMEALSEAAPESTEEDE